MKVLSSVHLAASDGLRMESTSKSPQRASRHLVCALCSRSRACKKATSWRLVAIPLRQSRWKRWLAIGGAAEALGANLRCRACRLGWQGEGGVEFAAGHGKGVSWHWPVLKTPSLADPELGSRILIIAAGPDNGDANLGGRITECAVELHFRAWLYGHSTGSCLIHFGEQASLTNCQRLIEEPFPLVVRNSPSSRHTVCACARSCSSNEAEEKRIRRNAFEIRLSDF